jgi:hypothetical protein
VISQKESHFLLVGEGLVHFLEDWEGRLQVDHPFEQNLIVVAVYLQ